MTNRKQAAALGTLVAGALWAAASHAVVATPAAAESSLNVGALQLHKGNETAAVSGTALNLVVTQGATSANPAKDVTVSAANTSAKVSSTLTDILTLAEQNQQAIHPALPMGSPFQITEEVGSGAYVPFTALTGLPTSTFAGAAASSSGNLLTGQQHGQLQAQVGVDDPWMSGMSDSTQALNTTFIVRNTKAQWFELSFQADGFLRAMLGGSDPLASAYANYHWLATVRPSNSSAAIVEWSPDGKIDALSGSCISNVLHPCVEYRDDFSLNDSLGVNGLEDDVMASFSGGLYQAEFFLDAGTYIFSIGESVHAEAVDPPVLPEPGTFALLGLGLAGLLRNRRRDQPSMPSFLMR